VLLGAPAHLAEQCALTVIEIVPINPCRIDLPNLLSDDVPLLLLEPNLTRSRCGADMATPKKQWIVPAVRKLDLSDEQIANLFPDQRQEKKAESSRPGRAAA
jgi:hypothetical protein